MRNYLITGAAGFIGSHLTEALIKRGDSVTGIDNFDPFYPKANKLKNIESSLDHPNFTFIETDIRDTDSLKMLFEQNRFDAVIHLAAKAGVRNSLKAPQSYYDVNVMGTLNLLEAMRNSKHTKLIFASSSSVYGNNTKVPFSETDPVDFPISPYAASKKSAELLCYSYHHLYNFDIYALRFFSVYGPRQRPDMGIHKFFDAFLNGNPITMYGDGNSKRDYTFIDDIIHGTIQAIDSCKGYEIINLGESKTTLLKVIIDEIRTITGKNTEVNSLPMQPGDVIQTNADISKARKLLNYDPKVDIQSGLKRHFEYLVDRNK